uniref:Trans-1,2-dihydrobenzene-1,2-diol dehydrogenase n=1 Tax=Meloidogyne floridensis TaxID=298350 RepID=A0A915PAK3_9BILA
MLVPDNSVKTTKIGKSVESTDHWETEPDSSTMPTMSTEEPPWKIDWRLRPTTPPSTSPTRTFPKVTFDFSWTRKASEKKSSAGLWYSLLSLSFVRPPRLMEDNKMVEKGIVKQRIIKAVASSNSFERAQKFCEDNLLDKNEVDCYGTYNELFNDEFIDVVYIANLNHQHKETVLAALNSNKNVLCEKPLAVNKLEVEEMVKKAKEKGLFLMEGYWTRCFPLWSDIMSNRLNSLGNTKLFSVEFGCPISRVNAMSGIKDGGEGYLLGSGCYCLMIAQLIFKSEKPLEIIVNGKLRENGLDCWANILIKYSDNKLA